jgi:hypothetical protein
MSYSCFFSICRGNAKTHKAPIQIVKGFRLFALSKERFIFF